MRIGTKNASILVITVIFVFAFIAATITSGCEYIVEMDYANHEVFAIRDSRTGVKLPMTIEQLKAVGATYEIQYVAPKGLR